jgi:hypothetical protein
MLSFAFVYRTLATWRRSQEAVPHAGSAELSHATHCSGQPSLDSRTNTDKRLIVRCLAGRFSAQCSVATTSCHSYLAGMVIASDWCTERRCCKGAHSGDKAGNEKRAPKSSSESIGRASGTKVAASTAFGWLGYCGNALCYCRFSQGHIWVSANLPTSFSGEVNSHTFTTRPHITESGFRNGCCYSKMAIGRLHNSFHGTVPNTFDSSARQRNCTLPQFLCDPFNTDLSSSGIRYGFFSIRFPHMYHALSIQLIALDLIISLIFGTIY